MVSYGLGKKHMLCGKILTGRLFEQGKTVYAPPLRCTYLLTDGEKGSKNGSVRLLVSVSKRNHKRAVRRNKLKRRMKEAYRLNRYRMRLVPSGGRVLLLAFIYHSKEVTDYAAIEKAVVRSLRKVEESLAQSGDLSAGPLN